MLRRMTRIVRGMVVYPERMRENLERSRGVVFSGTVLLELARKGISRERAYELVQRNAMRSFHEQQDFRQLLLADPDVTSILPPAEIELAFDLHDLLQFPPRGDGAQLPKLHAQNRLVATLNGRGHLTRWLAASGR